MSEVTLIHLNRQTVREMDDYMRQQGYQDYTKVSIWISKALEQEKQIAALQAELAVARGLIYSMRNCFNCKYEDACVMGDADRCGNGDGSTRLPDWEQALEGG